MDKALKQRLVGASILILLAVIFLPMVLDGPDPEQNRVISIETPERPQFDFESRRLPLDEQVAQQDTTDAADNSESAAAEEPDLPVGSETTQQPALDSSEPSPATVRPLADRTDSGESGADTGSDEVSTGSTESTAAPVQDDGGSEESESRSETTAQPVPTAGDVVIQVASFSDRANAERLAEQLRGLGLSSTLDSTRSGDGELTRVRVVGVEESDSADVVQRIQSAVEGVTPRVLASATTSAAASPAAGRWAVQVGSYSDGDNASNMVERLEAASFRAFSERSSDGGRELVKVKVGPVLERQQAEALMARIRTETGVEGVVVSYP